MEDITTLLERDLIRPFMGKKFAEDYLLIWIEKALLGLSGYLPKFYILIQG